MDTVKAAGHSFLQLWGGATATATAAAAAAAAAAAGTHDISCATGTQKCHVFAKVDERALSTADVLVKEELSPKCAAMAAEAVKQAHAHDLDTCIGVSTFKYVEELHYIIFSEIFTLRNEKFHLAES